MSAIGHKRLRRLQIEGAREPGPVELLVNVSTQVMSFQVGEGDTNNPAQPVHSILMSVTPQRPPAPIIHSTPATFIEKARRDNEDLPPANAEVSRGRPQEIVSE
jgi:hypothetical protein